MGHVLAKWLASILILIALAATLLFAWVRSQ